MCWLFWVTSHVYLLSVGFTTFEIPRGWSPVWLLKMLAPLKMHHGLKLLRKQQWLSAVYCLRSTGPNRAHVTGSTTHRALMKQQMVWRRIRPVYMAPQYTSTSHFLTQHSLSGQTVCAPEGRSGFWGEGLTFYPQNERVSRLIDLSGLVRFEKSCEIQWVVLCERSFSLHREVFSPVWHPVNHQREQLLFGNI